MTRARREIVSLSDTPYYHVICRCVRRSFLCGFDNHTQQSFEHRKQWIVDRIRLLSSLFSIDLCSYAIMSNHYHLVIKIDPTQTQSWSRKEVAQRWTSIYKGPLIIQKWLAGSSISIAEQTTIDSITRLWRKRLANLSWFMKCLNEPIARMANKEDGCTGHFWEARFKSQALLDDKALLACMVYVDLNPIRAGIRSTPESSDYTSIQERIKPRWKRENIKKNPNDDFAINTACLDIKPLLGFSDQANLFNKPPLPITFIDYLVLVDWTGRIIRDDKRGFIDNKTPPVAQRLSLEPDNWSKQALHFERHQHHKKVNSG